jgi:outer membrane biosynthesis protein TonB
MRENYRPYLLISLIFHLCLLLSLFFLEGPRVSEVIPRRVVIRFSEARQRVPAAVSPEQTRMPDLRPQELADSLQMQGPKTLAVPGTKPGAAAPRRQEVPSGSRRLSYARTETPVLPELQSPAARLLLPPELPSGEIREPEPAPGEGSGFSEPGALEWRGRERKLLKTAGIPFPDILLEEGVEVDVEAVFTVAPNGQVMEVDIVRTSGYASVDRAVERAIFGYLFEPSDSTTNDVGHIQYRFRLERGD